MEHWKHVLCGFVKYLVIIIFRAIALSVSGMPGALRHGAAVYTLYFVGVPLGKDVSAGSKCSENSII